LTARRQAIITDYEDEMAELYDAVEETTRSGISPPTEWNLTSTLDFVREVVRKVVVGDVQDDADIFRYRCESLQTTWIRNSLLRALRDSSQGETRQSAHNFVYDHPSIASLGTFILSLVSGKEQQESSVSKEVEMNAMASKYTHEFPKHAGVTDSPPSNAKVVLVTGTTGELGCFLLSQLVNDSNVRCVYALNRASRDGQSLRERQRLALIDRGLDANLSDSAKVVLLEVDVSAVRLNLVEPVYQEVRVSSDCSSHLSFPPHRCNNVLPTSSTQAR
jgi:hypothetical protein